MLQALELRVPCSPWQFMGMQRSICCPWRSHTPRQEDAREEAVNLWEPCGTGRDLQACGEMSLRWSRLFFIGFVTFWATHTGAAHARKDCSLWKSDLLAAALEEPLPVGWTYGGEFHGELSPGKGRISSRHSQSAFFLSFT